MAAAKLKKGDNVLVTVHPHQNNGDPEALGLVVRVLDVEDEDRVNVRCLLDGDETLLLRNVPVLSKKDSEADDAPSVFALRA